MKEHDTLYLFVYTTDASSKIHKFETTIRSTLGRCSEKEAIIELITSNPNISDYFLVQSEVIN
tara:strand:- start:10 stop:198 length:189 start_codon:yes stop_codon:yes gene_type:complete